LWSAKSLLDAYFCEFNGRGVNTVIDSESNGFLSRIFALLSPCFFFVPLLWILTVPSVDFCFSSNSLLPASGVLSVDCRLDRPSGEARNPP
jgi:hypothetical protein